VQPRFAGGRQKGVLHRGDSNKSKKDVSRSWRSGRGEGGKRLNLEKPRGHRNKNTKINTGDRRTGGETTGKATPSVKKAHRLHKGKGIVVTRRKGKKKKKRKKPEEGDYSTIKTERKILSNNTF